MDMYVYFNHYALDNCRGIKNCAILMHLSMLSPRGGTPGINYVGPFQKIFAHGCYVTSMSLGGSRMALDHSLTHSLTHSLDSD